MPNLPISASHPVGFVNPVTIKASAALEAAGAWDTPTIHAVAGAGSIVLSLTYTRGALNGAFDFQLQTSIYAVVGNAPAGAGEWANEAIYAPGAVVAGVDTTSLVQREFERYTSQGAAAETFTFGPIELGHVIERLRVTARESGVVGTPGTLAIVAELHT